MAARLPLLAWLRAQRTAALFVALAAAALLVWSAIPRAADDGPHHSRTFRSALLVAGDGTAFPDERAARSVELPDQWSRRRPGHAAVQWYRIEFQRPAAAAAQGPLAVTIPQLCSSYELQLNGASLTGGGRMRAPLTNNCNHPQLVELPAALLVPGRNRLDVRLAGQPREEVGSRWRAGGLSAVTIGPRAELEPGYARRLALGVDMPLAASATLLLLGGFMFVLGFIHRRESHLAYFGALAIGTALLDARLWLRRMPLGHEAEEFVLLALLAFVVWAAVQFLLRYAGARIRWVDNALPLQCALVALSMLLAGPTRLALLAWSWYAVFGLEIVLAALYHLRRHGRSAWLMAALLTATALALTVELVTQWSAERTPLVLAAPMAMPLVFALAGLRLLQQQGQALQHAQEDRRQLEQRVREATAEIERNYRQLAELQVEQVTERERKRIAADLHDDLGAKLLTIVHTSESERISTLAREALEEMRLSVRGLTGRAVQLGDALGDWRAETMARLAQAGIDGEWQAPDDLPQRLSARAYVQTTRILREATNNIIKHSNATHCAVRCGIAEGDFQLVIQDNGEGISPAVDARLDRGHGLASMKNRAKQLQGQCLVESGQGYGTVIRLTLPLDRATDPS
ncbi:MAG: sensor histidine kinase [Burkholderiaceae bacterium]|nr:sensor histidine kinase [Burkholderiaceae bacterium]